MDLNAWWSKGGRTALAFEGVFHALGHFVVFVFFCITCADLRIGRWSLSATCVLVGREEWKFVRVSRKD
jgi:hypothetical protein